MSVSAPNFATDQTPTAKKKSSAAVATLASVNSKKSTSAMVDSGYQSTPQRLAGKMNNPYDASTSNLL
jgi:hypothetical protein